MPQNEKLPFLSRISLILAMPAMRWALPLLILLLLVTGAMVLPATQIQNDDDVIKFLPQDDPLVVKFKDIGDRFHGLQMAIVGVEAKEGDIFTVENLTLLRRYAREFKQLECANIKDETQKAYCVSNTTCFTEIKDIAHGKTDDGEEEAAITDLVPDLPDPKAEAAKSPEIAAKLQDVKKRALSLDHVRGFLVSPDGKAAAVYAQVDDTNVGVKEAADQLKKMLIDIQRDMGLITTNENGEEVSSVNVFYAGSPFIGAYSADQSRSDMARLSPFVILAVVLIMWLTSKSLFATFIALFSVGVSIVWVLGGMHLMGHKMTLISTSLPVLLVALGSAYAIHLLTAILTRLDSGMEKKDAIREALIHTGPPVVICVLTTACGFFSFMAMDVDPMVEYGAAMGIATLVIMLVTFWVVTSACTLLPLKPSKEGRAPKWAMNVLKGSADACYKHGKKVAIAIAILIIAAGYFATKVEPRGDTSSLFAPGSQPIVADDFMVDRFGGANFIQTEINGNIKSPLVLRQIERMTAYINAHPRIAGIQSMSDIVIMVGGTMGDGQHIPASETLCATLLTLAYADDASVAMMAENTWKHTLMQIRVKGKDLEEASDLAQQMNKDIAHLLTPRVSIPRNQMNDAAVKKEREEMIEHVQWILKKYERDLDFNTIHKALFETEIKISREDIYTVIHLNLFDEEDAMVFLDPEKTNVDKLTDLVMAAIANGTYSKDWLLQQIKAVALPEELENMAGFTDGVGYVHSEIEDASVKKLRKARSAEIFKAANVTAPSEKFVEMLESAIWSLSDSVVYFPESFVKGTELEKHVIDREEFEVIPQGYPVIYTAMNDSVVYNQIVSLGLSLLMVFLCLLFFTRNFIISAVSLIPASVTVVVVFGIMGFFDIGMNVGSSMIAAISLSVGIDYACHLFWKFGKPGKDNKKQKEASDRMLETTGWGVVISALELGIGLSIFYFGELLPLRHFGVLTGVAMIVSAVASLTLLSALLRWSMKFIKTPQLATANGAPIDAEIINNDNDNSLISSLEAKFNTIKNTAETKKPYYRNNKNNKSSKKGKTHRKH